MNTKKSEKDPVFDIIKALVPDRYVRLNLLLGISLKKAKAAEIGERRSRKDGDHIKEGSGKWKKVPKGRRPTKALSDKIRKLESNEQKEALRDTLELMTKLKPPILKIRTISNSQNGLSGQKNYYLAENMKPLLLPDDLGMHHDFMREMSNRINGRKIDDMATYMTIAKLKGDDFPTILVHFTEYDQKNQEKRAEDKVTAEGGECYGTLPVENKDAKRALTMLMLDGKKKSKK